MNRTLITILHYLVYSIRILWKWISLAKCRLFYQAEIIFAIYFTRLRKANEIFMLKEHN